VKGINCARCCAVSYPVCAVPGGAPVPEVERNLSRISDRPALIVWSTKDFAFGSGERERFERTFLRHKTVLFNDASHFLQEDAGDRRAESIRMFRSEVTN